MKKNTISPLKDLTGLILVLSTTFMNHGALAAPAGDPARRATEGEAPGKGMQVDPATSRRRVTTENPELSSSGREHRRSRRNRASESDGTSKNGEAAVESFATEKRLQQAAANFGVSISYMPLNFKKNGAYENLVAKVLKIDSTGDKASSTLIAEALVETAEYWAANRDKVNDPDSARHIDEIVGQSLITFTEALRQMDEIAKTSSTANPALDRSIAPDLQARAAVARFAGSQLGAILREALNKSPIDSETIEAFGKKLKDIDQTVLRDKGSLWTVFKGEGMSESDARKAEGDFLEACARRI